MVARDIDIASRVNSQVSRLLKSRRERALCSVRSYLNDRAAKARFPQCLVHHKQVASLIKGQVDEISTLGRDKRTLYSLRGKFENRITLRNKEITRAIKGHSDRADAGGEGASGSIRRDLEDRAAAFSISCCSV